MVKLMMKSLDQNRCSAPSHTFLLGLFMLWATFSSPLIAQTKPPKPQQSYSLTVNGLDNFSFFDDIKKVSYLYRKQYRVLLSLSTLSRRALKDTTVIKDALDALGYRDSKVTYDLEQRAPLPHVTLTVDLGQRYHIRKVRILRDEQPYKSIKKLFNKKFPLKSGAPATGKLIAGVEDDLLFHLSTIGYPKARLTERIVTSNATRKTVDVVYFVALGPESYFGDVTYTSLQQVDTQWAQNRVPWKVGDVYDSKKVDLLRERLRLPQLFNAITIDENPMTSDGQIPFDVKTSEGYRHYYGGKASFSTSEGFGVEGFWGHRNLFNSAQNFKAEGIVSQIRQGATLHYSEPDFLKSNQTLFVTVGGFFEKLPAYRSIGGKTTFRLERAFDEKTKGSIGLEPDIRSVTQRSNNKTKFFRSLSAPVSLAMDRSTTILNPKEGWRLTTTFTPTVNSRGTKQRFFYKADFLPSAYFPLDRDQNRILAIRGLVGGIWGAKLKDIPVDKRLYSGGIDSIRGYGFQKIGPFKHNRPIGGRGVYELSLELRWKVTGNWSAVPFVEVGNILRPTLKETFKTSRIGVGMGVRYDIEGLGPVRVDVAFPMHRRLHKGKKQDAFFQFYMGIGQAF